MPRFMGKRQDIVERAMIIQQNVGHAVVAAA